MVYNTQDLIRILDQELQATWRGDRLLLSSEKRVGVPIVTKALNPDKLGKVFAYKDFCQQVHQYQQNHQVSGIIWRDICYQQYHVRLPEVHQQLIALESDKLILQQAKAPARKFWQQITQGLQLWRLENHVLQSLTPAQADAAWERAEWAEIDLGRNEFYGGLCWGDPKECRYRWSYPESGCDRLIASSGKPQQTNIF